MGNIIVTNCKSYGFSNEFRYGKCKSSAKSGLISTKTKGEYSKILKLELLAKCNLV